MQRDLSIGKVNAFQFLPRLPITGIDQALVSGRGGVCEREGGEVFEVGEGWRRQGRFFEVEGKVCEREGGGGVFEEEGGCVRGRGVCVWWEKGV